jgi:hypothetical protein
LDRFDFEPLARGLGASTLNVNALRLPSAIALNAPYRLVDKHGTGFTRIGAVSKHTSEGVALEPSYRQLTALRKPDLSGEIHLGNCLRWIANFGGMVKFGLRRVERLTSAIGHAHRATPLRDYRPS